MDLYQLNAFLKLGYFLDFHDKKVNSNGLKPRRTAVRDSEENLLNQARNHWYNAFSKLFTLKNKHLIPISGGLDSRAILATLLKYTEAKNISTYTFGKPGTYDYDIGNSIAKNLGTSHVAFSLDEYKFSTYGEIEIAKRTQCQTFLFHHPPLTEIDRIFGEGFQVWSGFFLDTLAGSKVPKIESPTLDKAKAKFLKEETFVKSVNLNNIDDEVLYPFLDSHEGDAILSFDEQLKIENRLFKHIAPQILFSGYDYKIPALDEELASFFLSLGKDLRYNSSFYRKFLLREFPFEFSLPTKHNYGLSLTASKTQLLLRRTINKGKFIFKTFFSDFTDPRLNYLDFQEAIRERPDLNKMIYENLMDLKNRKILDWLNIEKLWLQHNTKTANYADALIILASLEIHLKSGKEIFF